jgi:hypothetical protein
MWWPQQSYFWDFVVTDQTLKRGTLGHFFDLIDYSIQERILRGGRRIPFARVYRLLAD